MLDVTGLVRTLAREAWLREAIVRVPEPMEMNERAQVDAYADAGGQDDGIMAVSNLFHAAHASARIADCSHVVDLGCGPATQLVRIAQFNPAIRFTGVELAENMLERARQHVASSGVDNVEIVQGDMTRLDAFEEHSVDGVISTMTLHHLPSVECLGACFQSVRRVLRVGGALYLADFGRLKSAASVRFFAHMHESSLPPVVVTDYELSMGAAFSPAEYRELLPLLGVDRIALNTTALTPFMVMLATLPRGLDAACRARIASAKALIPREFQGDLSSLRLFFRLGGMSYDPFGGL